MKHCKHSDVGDADMSVTLQHVLIAAKLLFWKDVEAFG